MNVILFLLFLIFIFFIPIPVKFNFHYSNNYYTMKIYSFCISSSTKHRKHKKLFFTLNKLKIVIFKLKNFKFKPILKTKINISYSLDDAFATSMIYGLLQNIYIPLYSLLSLIFSVHKIKLNIIPHFQNRNLAKFIFSGIIFISLAQFIYITLVMKIFFKKDFHNKGR